MATKNQDTAPVKITQAELARIMYRNEMHYDRWDDEQDSLKNSYYNGASRFITLLQNAGYDIVKRQASSSE